MFVKPVLPLALIIVFFVSGCVNADSSLSKGASVYENFCGNNDYSVLKEKGVRMSSLVNDPELVIAFRNPVTGSVVLLDNAANTFQYLPEEVEQDDFYVLIDKRALDGLDGYCSYAVGINQRTSDFLIINASKLLLFS